MNQIYETTYKKKNETLSLETETKSYRKYALASSGELNINTGTPFEKFDGLSPYFANKQSILKKLQNDSYENIKISESLDITPSNLYHTFKDKDENNITILTNEQRDNAIYQIDNKDELEKKQEIEAKEKQDEQKQSIINNDDLNLTTKSEMLNEIKTAENNESTIDKVALKEEAIQDRVQEWVKYKDLASDKIEVEDVNVEEATNVRGWGSRWKKRFRRSFRRITVRDCRKRTSSGTSWWRYFWEVPYDTKRKIRKLGMNGYSYTWYTSFCNRDRQYNRTKWYVKKNNPIMFNAMKGTRISSYGKVSEGHSMPVIGYKGSCWKRIMPQKKWLLVDTEFRRKGYNQNQRGYIRFDSKANYFRAGTITLCASLLK